MPPLSKEQRRVLATIKRVARQKGASPRELKAAIETGLVEANLTNPNYGDRDSVGWRQERSHYGPKSTRLNVAESAARFFDEADKLNTEGGSAGQLAQRVQRSAFPLRYDQRSAEAERLMRGGAGPGRNANVEKFKAVTQTIPGVDRSQDRRALLANYLLSDQQYRDGGLLELKAGMDAAGDTPSTTRRIQRNVSSHSEAGAQPRSGSKAKGPLKELFYDPGVNIDEGRKTAPIGGHGTHVHVAIDNDADRALVLRLAKKAGVTITSEGGGKHATGSFHYQQTKAGKSKGIDFGGDPKAMARFNRLVARRFT